MVVMDVVDEKIGEAADVGLGPLRHRLAIVEPVVQRFDRRQEILLVLNDRVVGSFPA